VEALYSLLGLLELTSYFLGQVAYGSHFDFGGAGQVGNHQRHLTGEQQCGDRALKFVAKSLLYLLPHQQDNSRTTRSLPLMAKFTCTGMAVSICSSTTSL